MNVWSFSLKLLGAVAIAVVSLSPEVARAQLAEFYIGVDGLETLTGGTYAGEANPNHGRLTFLLNHGNHYHAIGVYSYSGPADNPVVNDTNANNRIPESSTGQPPLVLQPGSGPYAGRLVTMPQIGVEYSDLEMLSVHSLDGNSDDTLGLYNSSGGRWNGHFDQADIHLELISATPGLNVGTPTNPNALPLGADVHVGEGDELFSFTPVLWVDAGAAIGTYSAEFQLTDEAGQFGSSGRFFIDVQVVPEPSAFTLLMSAALSLFLSGRRRRG